MGKRISADRKKNLVWIGEEFVAHDNGLKTPGNYGRCIEAFDGVHREGNEPRDREQIESVKLDNDRYRRLDISNMHFRDPLEDYTRP